MKRYYKVFLVSCLAVVKISAQIPAVPYEITAVGTTTYTSNLNTWTGSWQAPQAVYDRDIYQDSPSYWFQSSSNEGTTWNNTTPGTSYGVLLVDLKQTRTINRFRVFQMFSDGKTTAISIYKNQNYTGDTRPSSSSDGWVSVVNSYSIGAGTDYTTYIGSPTSISVTSFSTRYLMLYVYNNGSLGSSSYIELKGIKAFYYDGSSYSINYMRGAPQSAAVTAPGFNPTVSPGSINQAFGRFLITPNDNGITLNSVTITLNNSRTGASNFKLWKSNDNSFNSAEDTQIGSTVVNDLGDGGSISFTSLNSMISLSGTYYFVTSNLASNATGSIQAVIPSNSSISITGGSISSTISNLLLSTGSIPLPVELTSFTSKIKNHSVVLEWQTATEVNNYGFEVERKVISRQSSVSNWEKIGFIEGHGNSNSPKEYKYVDANPDKGTVKYRLKQIDNDGSFSYSPEVEVEMENILTKFALYQNYPNPFNPATIIKFSLPESGIVKLILYNILGQEIQTLVNEYKEAGIHNITLNASELNSGMYIYKMESGSFVQTRKMTLIK